LTFNDVVHIFVVSISLLGCGAWAWRLRRWPLMWAALIALSFNVLFVIVKETGIWTSNDLNQLSVVRILLLTIVIAAVPFSTHESPQ
jgi:hypothetical protein